MPRKSARENGGFRRTGWKAKLAKREADEKRIVKNIYIGASNARRWIILKKKLEYRSDVDFVAYLLNLAEPFSGKGKLDRKDKEDNDGKNNPIPRVPDINVGEEDNTESQEKEVVENVDFHEAVGEVGVSGEVKVIEDEEEGHVIDEEGGGEGDNEDDEDEDEDEEEEDEDDDDEEEDEDEDGSAGEWTGGRQPLRRSLRSIPTSKDAKMSVRRSARNVRREEEEEEEEDELEEERGDEVGGEMAGLRRKKRGDRSQRRQRRRERKKRRRRKKLKGSGAESSEDEEEDSEMESEGEQDLLRAGDEVLRHEEGMLEVANAPVDDGNPIMDPTGQPLLAEPPKKGRRGRKKKVVAPEVSAGDEITEKREGETEDVIEMTEVTPVDPSVNVSREADSLTQMEEPAVLIDPEGDRISKHHRHHRRRSRKSKDGLDDDGAEDEAEGEDEGIEMGDVGTGRRKKRRKRGRGRREEECGGEDLEGMGDDQEEENFPRYEVVEGVSEEGEANQQDKTPLPMQSMSQEEGVLIEVGERVKLKRRRKRRHSRGEDGEMVETDGLNGDAASSEDPLNILRKTTKHKKRKHGHGDGHGNRRKHHDVRKVPVDGVLSEPSPVSTQNLHPEGSPEASASLPDPASPTTPTSSSTPPSVPLVNKGIDNKQRVAIRITLCGECDSRHVLDACPLKRPLTIIHDTVVLRNSSGNEQTKDEIVEGASLLDTDTKSFATEEEEELVDGEDTQDETCKKDKKITEEEVTAEIMPAVMPTVGVKELDERRRQRNGLSEGMEERLPVPNGKYRPGTERVSTIAQDAVNKIDGENGDDSIVEGKGIKDESGPEENKIDSQEEMLANGDASIASNSTSTSKPMNVDADDMESANETLTSQPSPLPMPEPISTADTAIGSGNNANGGKTFAEASLPMALKLETREAGHGPGVTAKRPIARFTQFGPLLGRRIREMDIPDDFGMRHIWEVIGATGRFLISTEDPTTSNWLRFIRPAPTREQRNVAPVTRGDRLYFVTTAPLQVGEELLYWPDESSGTGTSLGVPQPSTAQGPNSSSNTSSSSSSASSAGAGWAKKKMEKTNCGGCNLRFGHPLYYRLHCSVFHDPNFSLTIRKYHCKVCGAAVLGKENIMRHAAENHDGKGAYQCQFCKKFFLRLNYLEMHRTYGCAANPQRTRPLCDFCGRKFCQPQKLKVHIKRMHSDMADVLREFQCKLCLKLLGSRAALQRHMKEVHHRDVVGACACDRCGKTFQNKSNLKIHMLTHSGVKPFRCREGNCPAAFTTKQCLQFHYKKVHGYGEDNMPTIERCVAYTFDAYSGGTVEDPGRGKVPLFSSNRLEKDQEDIDSNPSNQAPDSEPGEDESGDGGGRSLSPQRGRKELGDIRKEKGISRGRGRRPGRPVGRNSVGRDIKEGMQPKLTMEGDGLVEAMVPSVIPEDIMPPSDADVLPPPPPVIPSLPDAPDCKEAILGNMADSQPPPLTPQPGPLPTEVAPQTPTLEAYNGGQSALSAAASSIGSYADHSRVPYPGKVVSKGSKKWMGDGSIPMRPTLEAEMEDEDEDDDEDEEDEDDEDDGVGKRVVDEGVVGEGQVVGDVYGAFPDDSRFVPVAEDGEEGFRRPEESNASLLVEAALDAAERDMSSVAVAEDDTKPHQDTDGGYLTSPPRTNGPDRHMDEDEHQRILHHPQPSHHAHHHLQHHHHLSLHHHQLPHPHHPHHPHVHHHLPPASHLHVQGGALMLHHPHHHHPTHHAVMHQEEDEEEERMGPGSEAASVGTIVERIVNTSLAEEEEGDGREDVPHPGIRAMHLLHPDAYAPDPHGRLPPAGSLPSPRNMTLLGMKAAVKVEEELHMAAMQQQQQQREEEEEGLDMSYKHNAGHYGRAVSGMAHHMQEEEDGTQGVGGVGDPSADDLQDFRVLRSPPGEGRFEQSQQGLDMSRGSFPFALPAARCFPLYEGSASAADVARSVDLRRAGLAYTSPPLPPYSQSLDLTPMRTRHSVDLSLPRTLVGTDGVGPPQGGGGQSPPPPSPMHRHLCHAPPASPHHHVHHHHGVDPLGCVVGGDDGGEGGSGGISPPPAAYQPGAYLHAPPSYHRQPPQHPPSPPPSPYHPQARTAPHMPPPPSASPSPYHHYSGYY